MSWCAQNRCGGIKKQTQSFLGDSLEMLDAPNRCGKRYMFKLVASGGGSGGGGGGGGGDCTSLWLAVWVLPRSALMWR